MSAQLPFSHASIAERILRVDPGTNTTRFELELTNVVGELMQCELLCTRYCESGHEVIQGNVRNIAKRRNREI